MNSRTKYYTALVLTTAVYVYLIVHFWNSDKYFIIAVLGAAGIFGNTLLHLLTQIELRKVDRKNKNS